MRKSCESVREGILLEQTVSVLRRQKVVNINKMETLLKKKKRGEKKRPLADDVRKERKKRELSKRIKKGKKCST